MKKTGVVLGRKIFVDLWSLVGFAPCICENPRSLGEVWEELVQENVAFVLYEPDWFEQVPQYYRQQVQHLARPVWIPFPNMRNIA
jgi:hypothetical protein